MINDYLRIKKLIKNSIVENIFLDIEDSVLIKEENGKYSIIGLEDYVICEMISRDIHKVKLNDEKEIGVIYVDGNKIYGICENNKVICGLEFSEVVDGVVQNSNIIF